eukprot:4542230-Prymnesium_polylepis.1
MFAPVAKILLPHALKDEVWEAGLCWSRLGLLGAKFVSVIQQLRFDEEASTDGQEEFDLECWLIDVASLPADDAAPFVKLARLKCSPEVQPGEMACAIAGTAGHDMSQA